MADGGWTWRAIRGLSTAARLLLSVHALVTICFAVLLWLAGADADPQLNAALGIFGLIQFGTFVLTGIVVLRWFYVSSANAWALGGEDLTSPGLAVGYFFIPFVNLVMPYVVLRELWQASGRARDWQAESVSPVIGLWWALWLGRVVGYGISILSGSDADGEPAAATVTFTALASLSSAGAALCLAWIVGCIQVRQASGRPAEVFE